VANALTGRTAARQHEEQQVLAFSRRTSLALKLVPDVNLQSVSIFSTPTVIVVGRDGRVKRAWRGASEAIEKEITASVREAS
jgi:hypothetical protein